MDTLDGRPIAKELRQKVSHSAEQYRSQGIVPTLAIITATADPQTGWYVRSLERAAGKVGITARVVELSATASAETIATALRKQAADPAVHGLILQTPLPAGVDTAKLLPLIPIEKDVDGANPGSAGRLVCGLPAFAPATAEAVMAILHHYKIDISGQRGVVVGRSRVVGRPVAELLLQADATVTVCHSRSRELAAITKQADILVVAAGKPGLITADYVQPGAVVIDVGTNVTTEGHLLGDVTPDVGKVARLSPVPGGVGPVTTLLILQHVVTAVALLKSAD